MSRCFPFPPPGYERKIKADDPDLLKKEKHRDKKHKKEKDKDKKRSNEKQEKERTDEKRREKKDKNEKRRDKKERNLDKNKYKGDGLFPDEKRAVEPPDVHLYKPSVILGETRAADLSVFNNGCPVSKNNHLASQTKIFKNGPSLGRRNTDEERKINSQLPNKNVSTERKEDGMVKITSTGAIPVVAGKEKPKEKSAIAEKMDVVGVIGEARFRGNAFGQNVVGPVKLSGESTGPPNFVGMVQNRVGAMSRPVQKKPEHKLDEKEKIRGKEGDYKKGEKRKEEEREESIYKDKETEKAKATSEQKHDQIPRKKDGSKTLIVAPSIEDENKMDLSGPLSDGIQSMPKPSSQGGATLLRKRKDIGLNGVNDEHMARPNKLARTTTSTHQLTKNGMSLEPCQNSAMLAARPVRPPMNIKVDRTFAPDDAQKAPLDIKVGGKDRKVNGIQTGPTAAKFSRKSEVSAKPHPDTKYLSQVLSVPKLDQWPEFDDQEWLFSSNSSQTRKPQVETSGVEEEWKVWASGLWLDPVDVFALPYVIPH